MLWRWSGSNSQGGKLRYFVLFPLLLLFLLLLPTIPSITMILLDTELMATYHSAGYLVGTCESSNRKGSRTLLNNSNAGGTLS